MQFHELPLCLREVLQQCLYVGRSGVDDVLVAHGVALLAAAAVAVAGAKTAGVQGRILLVQRAVGAGKNV